MNPLRSEGQPSHLARVATLLVLLLLAGLFIPWTAPTEAQGGTVTGTVVNGTPDGTIPNDLTITLHVFSGMDETATYTTTVTPEPAFRFEGISFTEGDTLVARAVYRGVTYVSEFTTIEEDQQEVSLPLTIYQTTEDPANVAISQLHLFVNRVGQQIQVGTYAVMGNTGNATYIGSEDASTEGQPSARTTWSAKLPGDADNLQFETGELGARFVALEDGFADTRAIPPGGASVETSFTYEIPFREGVEIEQSFDVPVRAAVLVLPEGDWALEGPEISSQGTLDTQMGAALSYTTGPLGAGQPLAFTIAPRTAATGAGSDGAQAGSSGNVVLGIAVLVAAGVAVILMWRSPSPGPVPAEVKDQIHAIASLDREFEKGRLPEQSYRERRKSLKEQVRRALSGERQ